LKKARNFFKNSPLVVKILIGVIAGVLFGLWVPGIGFASIFGDLFVGALKAIAPILVFILVISSLSKAGNGHGRRFGNIIAFYLSTTFLAAAVATVFSFVFRVTVPLEAESQENAPTNLGEVFGMLLNNMVMNPLKAMIENNYIGILMWSVVIGIAFRTVASDKTKEMLEDVADAVSKTVSYVISFAPLGIFGLVFKTVHESGIEIFKSYGKLLLVLVVCMLTVSLVVNPVIAGVALKRNPYPLLFMCLRESGLTAFFTRSSAAAALV